jgi:hypothetical protein
MKWAGGVVFMGEMKNMYKILVRKPEGMGPFRRPRCRWDYNITMDLNGLGWRYVDRSHLTR